MSNKQQTAVEWFSVRRDVLEIEVRLGKLSPIEYAEELTKAEQQAKEMEKQQTRDDIKNELKLIGNYFDVGKLDQREQGHHIRFTSILKDRFDFYNETYGGNK